MTWRAILATAATAVALLPGAAHAATRDVTLRFAAVAGDRPVACGTPIAGLGTGGATAELADLRFYVSDVRLVRADGRTVRVTLRGTRDQVAGRDGVALVDLEDGTGACAREGTRHTNAAVRGTVPSGRYVGARWTVGVPFALNHGDVVGAPGPLALTAMAWSWQAGRKFAKIDLVNPQGGRDMGHAAQAPVWSAFLVHLGSTGCVGNPATGATVRCRAANRAAVRLRRLDPARQRVLVDLRALVAGDDLAVDRADAPGCMSGPSDPECGPVFRALGVGWAGDGTADGFSPVGRQTVFRAGRR